MTPRVLFLEASDEALVRRFEAVRRPHPLQDGDRLVDGIARERALLRELRGDADLVLDTSLLNVHELRAKVVAAFCDEGRDAALHLTVLSFGFKYGLPVDADLVVDMRFLPNPHWEPGAAAADRPRRRGAATSCSASRAPAEFLDRYEGLAAAGVRGLRARGQALRAARRRLHRRQAPQRRHRRGARPPASPAPASTCRSSTATWGASERPARAPGGRARRRSRPCRVAAGAAPGHART